MYSASGIVYIKLNVNGETYSVAIEPWETLLQVLRNKLGLTGSKVGCENGDCGACTVLIDGKPIKSCLKLAIEVQSMAIMTIEGLKNTEIQSAFVTEGGFQCGFCTSGFLMNAYALLEDKPNASEVEKVEWLSANLCRCTGYEGIKNAVNKAQKQVQERVIDLTCKV